MEYLQCSAGSGRMPPNGTPRPRPYLPKSRILGPFRRDFWRIRALLVSRTAVITSKTDCATVFKLDCALRAEEVTGQFEFVDITVGREPVGRVRVIRVVSSPVRN